MQVRTVKVVSTPGWPDTTSRGNSEDRTDTVSVFNGPPPTIRVLHSEGEEIKTLGNWLAQLAKSGLLPHECGIFVRSSARVPPHDGNEP
jgi:hypothetical protein